MAESDVTVVVVDDDSSVRHGVARLARSAGFSTRTFASPTQFLKQPLPQSPACLVLDVFMDELTGLDVQERLLGAERKIPIIFLSGHGDVPMTAKAMKRGAMDFLEKPFEPTELIGAIIRAVENDRKDSAARAQRNGLVQRYELLTLRERDVMKLVVNGLLNKEIAAELGISEKTVKVHRGRVMEKMQVRSLAELVKISQQIA
jgi:FixJ family two-component response regulator